MLPKYAHFANILGILLYITINNSTDYKDFNMSTA